MSLQVYYYLPNSIEELVVLVKELVKLPVDLPNSNVHALQLVPQPIIEAFNEHVDEMLVDDNVRTLLVRSTAQFNVVQFLKYVVSFMISRLDVRRCPYVSCKLFEHAYVHFTSNERLMLVRDLSSMELTLLIVIYKELEFNRITKYNFDMIYERYMSFLSHGAQNAASLEKQDLFHNDRLLTNFTADRHVILRALEKLLELGLIKVSGSGIRSAAQGKLKRASRLEQNNIRLNEIHPSELQHFIKEHASEFESELVRFAS